jgi:MFS family permease
MFHTCFRSHGFPNNLETYGLISGLWTSTFALGAFVGPSIAGILYDSMGFRNGTMFIVLLNVIVVRGLVTLYPMTQHSADSYTEVGYEDSVESALTYQRNMSSIFSVQEPT